MRIATSASRGQVVSVQVSYHPGWHAKVNGIPREIRRDALGLMWFRPECNGPCEAVLEYDGGWELGICRVISYATLFLVLGFLVRRIFRRAGVLAGRTA